MRPTTMAWRSLRNWSIAVAPVIATSVTWAASLDVALLTPQFDARITLSCDESTCEGPTTVELRDSRSGRLMQTLQVDAPLLQPPDLSTTQTTDRKAIGLITEDFNFDGQVDLAIYSGNHGSYSGPAYDVYVYNRTRQRFVLSEELTELATNNLGLFEVDKKRKRLVSYAKSGCCWHKKTAWIVVPQHGLKEVWSREEAGTADGRVEVTISEMVHGKWRARTRSFPMDTYYGKQR